MLAWALRFDEAVARGARSGRPVCAWRWLGCARWAAGPPKPPCGSPGPGRFLTALQAGPLHAIVDLDETAVALQVGKRDTARTLLAAAGGQFEHSA